MVKKGASKSFNDKMVSRTVIPVIYLWMIASGAVVGMGIFYPDVVLMNLDGFIALIAIIGGVAAPAFNTLLRMWEAEQTAEGDLIPTDAEHERVREAAEHEHQMEMEKRLEKPWASEDDE